MNQTHRESMLIESVHPLSCGVCSILLSLATLASHSPPVLAQNVVSGAFTYQGRLAENGSPASGIFDLRFTIYDSGDGGNPMAEPVTNAAAAVSHGLFTVTLDFGGAVFDGGARWLEVGVRTNGAVSDFSLLSPRQQVTATPYALYAGGANAAGLSGTVADNQLPVNLARLDASNQVFTGPVQFGNPANTFAGAFSGAFIGNGTFTGNGAYLTNLPLASLVVPASFGTVVAWGRASEGQDDVPADLSHVVAAAAGGFHSLALRLDGTVVAWGYNLFGQTNVPAGLANVIAVAGGYEHSLALKNDGTVVAWGAGKIKSEFSPNFGQSIVPANLTNVAAVAAGEAHSLALKNDGTIVAWGSNKFGQTTVPANLSNVVAVAAGYNHSLALKRDGTVVAWGDSLGTQIPMGLRGVAAIAGGSLHSLALKSDGTVVSWGALDQTTVPANLNNVVAVAAGDFHNLALKHDGTIVAWGDNDFGQTAVPLGLKNVLAVAGGYRRSLVLRAADLPAQIPRLDQFNTFVGVNSFNNPANSFAGTFIGDGAALAGLNGANLQDGTVTATKFGADLGVWSRAGTDLFYNTGNVGIGTNLPAQKLHIAGNILASGIIAGSSDRQAKTNFAAVDAQAVLAKVTALPVQHWTFHADPGTPHLGPTAQDFYAAFHLGLDDKHIAMADADGVALAAIQGLSQKLEEQARLKDAEIETLKKRLDALEKLLRRAAKAQNGTER